HFAAAFCGLAAIGRMRPSPLIYVKGPAPRHTHAASETNQNGRTHMRQVHHIVKPASIAGLAVSALLGFAGVTFSSAPAGAVIYCTYVGYPAGCIVRPGV